MRRRISKLKAILFDVDGTLLNTTELIFQAYEHVLPLYGCKTPKRAYISPLIGRSLEGIYKILAPDGDFAKFHQAHNKFQLENLSLSYAFKGIPNFLKKLKKQGFKLAAITSRWRVTLIPTLEMADLLKYFEAIIAADDVSNHKPNPEPILKALKDLKVSPKEAVMVGDGDADIIAAKAAGIKTIGVTWGFGQENLLKAKPDKIANNLKELKNILE